MLVVEPDRRYTLKQIIKHRWLSDWAAELNDISDCIGGCSSSANAAAYTQQSESNSVIRSDSNSSFNTHGPVAVANLDTEIMRNMLQLPGLTADMIAQSVHNRRFDNIYAIYNLLSDKLQQKRREHHRMQHQAAYSRYIVHCYIKRIFPKLTAYLDITTQLKYLLMLIPSYLVEGSGTSFSPYISLIYKGVRCSTLR